MFIQFIRVNKTPFMYIDRILPFTTFISRNKHKKNIRLRLYWLRLRVAEAEVQKYHCSKCKSNSAFIQVDSHAPNYPRKYAKKGFDNGYFASYLCVGICNNSSRKTYTKCFQTDALNPRYVYNASETTNIAHNYDSLSGNAQAYTN